MRRWECEELRQFGLIVLSAFFGILFDHSGKEIVIFAAHKPVEKARDFQVLL